MTQKLKKIIWQSVFTREGFPFFITYASFGGYVLDMEKRIGLGYRDQLLVSNKNILTVYSSTRDAVRFKRKIALAKKFFFIKTNQLILDELKKSKKIINSINILIKRKKVSDGELVSVVDDFYKAYRSLYSIYRFPTIVDQFQQGKVSREILKKLASTKDLCGRFFTKVDSTTLHKIKKLISKKIGLDKDFVLFMSYKEIISSLKKRHSIIDLKEMKTRYNAYIYMAIGRRLRLYTGKEANELCKKLRFIKQKNSKCRIIYGKSAFKGKAYGRVKVVHSMADLTNRVKGDVLVTPMTTIKFTPYLKKFSAIITDEGGITCHAAIIAREMNKPCVIGTRNATKVLKDGDIVEVNANHGVVTVIKR